MEHAVTVTYPLEGLLCGTLLMLNGNPIGNGLQLLSGRNVGMCTCVVICKFLLRVQAINIAWIDEHVLFSLSQQGLTDCRTKVGRIRCLYNKINQSPTQVLLCVPETGSVFHTQLLFVLEVCYADKLGVRWLFIAESRELLCFGKSSGVPEGPCLICASGYSWLLILPASVSIRSQQQCLQEALGLIFLGSDVFFIRSALKLLGAKSQSSWRREPRQWSLRARNINVSVQMKGNRKGRGETAWHTLTCVLCLGPASDKQHHTPSGNT